MGQQIEYGYFFGVESCPITFKIYWRDVLKESKSRITAFNMAITNADLKAKLVDGVVSFILNIDFDNSPSKRIVLDGGDGINVELCPDELRNVLTENQEVLMRKLNSEEAFI